ncbi:hypothetical protein Hamer_G002175, partial [Homarus americanus]
MDAVKDVPLAKIDLLLLGIYQFYEKSSLNRSMLKQAHEICQLPFLSLEHTQKSYKAIVLHMQQTQNPNDTAYHKDLSRKAKKYLILLTSADVIKYIHLLLDILSCLRCLSEQFQHRQTNCLSTVDLLNKYLTSPGPSQRKILGGDTTIFQGEKLSYRYSTFTDARHDMLTSLNTKYSGNEGFGDTTVGALAQSLEKTLREAEVDPIKLEDEWAVLKCYLYKMNWHSSLTDDHLTDLLVVQLQSECISNFNPEQAINRFLTNGTRRVDGYNHTDGCNTEEVLDDIKELDKEHMQKLIDQIR